MGSSSKRHRGSNDSHRDIDVECGGSHAESSNWKIAYKPAAADEPQGHYAIRLSLCDGSRPWLHMKPGPRSERAEKLAREYALEASERARKERWTSAGVAAVLNPERAAKTVQKAKVEADARDAMAEWVKAWILDRKLRRQASTSDSEAHYRKHIVVVTGGKHIRDWTVDDARAIVHALDEKVQAGEIKWKSALNIWATARKMLVDSVKSKVDALRCREDNPALSWPVPARGAKRLSSGSIPVRSSHSSTAPTSPCDGDGWSLSSRICSSVPVSFARRPRLRRGEVDEDRARAPVQCRARGTSATEGAFGEASSERTPGSRHAV